MSRTPSVLSRALARFALWALLLAGPAQAQLVLTSTFSLSPTSATGGGTISVGASRLADGRYQVLLINDRNALELVDIASGTGEFQRYVRLPALAAGTYDVELRVDTRLVSSRSLRILSPLPVTTSSASPRAGSTVAFTVTGLTKGSLSLYYAGKAAWGPVNVEAGSYSGKFVVPTDRPATLPADVVLQARNSVGRTVPRVGSRTLAVQGPDRNPLIRIGSSSTSTGSVTLRQGLTFDGSVVGNDLEPAQATVQYWWRGADGRVMPMGAQQAAVRNDGSFSARMMAPHVGTMSAGRAAGSGTVFAVGQAADRYGVRQQRPGLTSPMTVAIDTDAAVDINLTLVGSDGLRIPNARVVLATAQLDALYPPNDNGSPVRLDGGVPPAEMVSQFTAAPSDQVLGCPNDLERQATDANGRAEFEFGLSLPQGGYNVDGSGPAPSVTIQPTETCTELPTNQTGSNQSASNCTVVDPAGIHATLTVLAAHTGYGWLNTPQANQFPIERPLRIDVRIDRYTGSVQTRVCPPDPSVNYGDLECEERTFQRSANLTVTLPKLPASGLLLTDPTWTQGANVTWPEVTGRFGSILEYRAMPDLSVFENKASITPAAPFPRTFQVGYVRGAGNTLESAVLHLPGRAPIALRLTNASDGCDVSATEVWGMESAQNADLADFLRDLRFPGTAFPGKSSIIGVVVAKESVTGRTAVRAFRFHFARPKAATRALADIACPGAPAGSCVAIDLLRPHYAKVTPPPGDPQGVTQTGDGSTAGCADDDCDDYAELKSKRNAAQAHLDLQFCLPEGTTGCGNFSSVASSHQQHSQQPDTPPPAAGFSGAGGGSQPDAPWKTLFDKTIPLFRWYWGVPEVFSAEVFADLGLKAEYLFNYVVEPLAPLESYLETGGRMDILITIGVDVDVLFGILVDAGAAITGKLSGEVIARAEADAPTQPCTEARLDFGLDFNYWVEIGCPVPFPFDPTCYIPDIEGRHNIFSENIADGTSCRVAGQAPMWDRLEHKLAALRTGTQALPAATLPSAVRPAARRSMNRHPALAIDSAGNRLALYVSATGKLLADDFPVDGARSTTMLSEAYGIRDVAVVHYGTDRAVAVWAQSDITSAPRQPVAADLASRQHLRYAVFDGDAWSSVRTLTAPGFGEGGVRLARCVPRALFYRSDCDENKASVVFQRNTARRMGGESHIYLSHFDGVGFGPPQRVDTSGIHNITPAIAYRNAQPVVAWVRYAPDAGGGTDEQQLSNVAARNLALRVMDGSSAEEIDTRLTRVAQPELATTSDNRLAIAFTRVAAGDAFVGTRHALHLGERTCANGACTLRTFAVRDQHGRLVYGERPRLVANHAGGVSVLFRGLAYGPRAGAASVESNLMPGDPLGMQTTRGELLETRSLLTSASTHVLALTNDARGHLQGAAAFDPAAQEVVALSALLPQDIALAKRAREQPPALAKLESVDEGLVMAAVGDLPDLRVAALTSTATRLTPGASLTASVVVENAGSEWTPATDRTATLRLYWDEPQARETLYGNLAIPALGPGATHRADVVVTVPAAFAADERQSLRAELVIESEEGELQGDNNALALAIGGMPVPSNLRALSTPGSRIVNLAWDSPADARIAGYRVWIDDDQGRPVPIGSSFNRGFADLSALFGFRRNYRVSTYSSRGVESELSEPLLASPVLAVAVEGDAIPDGPAIFGNGFE